MNERIVVHTLEHGGRSDLSVWKLSLSFSRLFLSEIMWYTWLLLLLPLPAAAVSSTPLLSDAAVFSGASKRLLVMLLAVTRPLLLLLRGYTAAACCVVLVVSLLCGGDEDTEEEGDAEERTAIMARIMATSSPANGSKAVSPKEVESSMEMERLDDGEDEYVRSCCVIGKRFWCPSAAKQLVSMSSAASPLAGGGPVIWMSSTARKLAVQLVE
jgi:hypothetical protein